MGGCISKAKQDKEKVKKTPPKPAIYVFQSSQANEDIKKINELENHFRLINERLQNQEEKSHYYNDNFFNTNDTNSNNNQTSICGELNHLELYDD